jgi:aryl-alcohol dehydrogenase-like predicted oxidoreductase
MSKLNYFTTVLNGFMQYRKFGNTELMVSEIGFGAWAIGGSARVGNTAIGWGPADDTTSKKAILAAVNAGINFFDTADFYGLGHSEKILGEVLKKNKSAVIATKVGHRNIDEKIVVDYSKEYIIKACEESLQRLKREVIDYYQLHSARMPHLLNGECVEAMQLLQRQGKIRYWGLSLNTFDPEAEAKFLIEENLGNGFQLVFNLVNQKSMDIIRYAALRGYGLIARMPLQFGLLTGKFSADTKFKDDDHRTFRLTPEIIGNTLKILEAQVWPIAEKEQLTKTQLALSFILSFKEISTTIPGIRTPDHVVQNTKGLRELKKEDLDWLQSIAQTHWKPIVELMEKQG